MPDKSLVINIRCESESSHEIIEIYGKTLEEINEIFRIYKILFEKELVGSWESYLDMIQVRYFSLTNTAIDIDI